MGTQKFIAYLRHHGITFKRFRYGNKLSYAFRVKWVISREDRLLLNELRMPVKKSDKIKRVK